MLADICCQYELLSKTTMANRLFLVPSIHREYQNNRENDLNHLVSTTVYSPYENEAGVVKRADRRNS